MAIRNVLLKYVDGIIGGIIGSKDTTTSTLLSIGSNI